MIEVPIYLKGTYGQWREIKECVEWASNEFGTDFRYRWKFIDKESWLVGCFKNSIDAVAFKLKFGS